MQKKRFIVLVAATLLFNQAWAAQDVTTQPDKYYLMEAESPNSLLILPPPPTFDSVAFLYDKVMYDWGKSMRHSERGKQAYDDANVTEGSVAKNFSPAFGFDISAKTTPETFKLISTMQEDAGDLATRSAKQFYNRIRPFSFFHESTCRPEDEKTLSTNGSYPSGHTTIGFATALVLAEVNPARQNEILKRGYEVGVSRVICGYHWQSDIDAARVVAASVVTRLHNNKNFIAQLDKAKQEIVGLNAKQ